MPWETMVLGKEKGGGEKEKVLLSWSKERGGRDFFFSFSPQVRRKWEGERGEILDRVERLLCGKKREEKEKGESTGSTTNST